jgi:hypothetical protein
VRILSLAFDAQLFVSSAIATCAAGSFLLIPAIALMMWRKCIRHQIAFFICSVGCCYGLRTVIGEVSESFWRCSSARGVLLGMVLVNVIVYPCCCGIFVWLLAKVSLFRRTVLPIEECAVGGVQSESGTNKVNELQRGGRRSGVRR